MYRSNRTIANADVKTNLAFKTNTNHKSQHTFGDDCVRRLNCYGRQQGSIIFLLESTNNAFKRANSQSEFPPFSHFLFSPLHFTGNMFTCLFARSNQRNGFIRFVLPSLQYVLRFRLESEVIDKDSTQTHAVELFQAETARQLKQHTLG